MNIAAMKYDYLPKNKLVAVVEIADAKHAVPLCEALIAGGVIAVEITLRTPAALDAVRLAAAANLPIAVGAGTILSVTDLQAAKAAGAAFFVSPATTPALLKDFASALGDAQHTMIPGVATASEAMAAYAAGYEILKFFPAEPSGGVAWIKSVAGPLPHIRFMPTGGVREATLKDYTRLKTIAAVGGTWIAPAADIAAGNWALITQRAAAATALI
jgi:2-dehydro-3-deoxyphosphogluconate aldolase/(4S)-4-hydroxy-2-oxoglutarate aldolase